MLHNFDARWLSQRHSSPTLLLSLWKTWGRGDVQLPRRPYTKHTYTNLPAGHSNHSSRSKEPEHREQLQSQNWFDYIANWWAGWLSTRPSNQSLIHFIKRCVSSLLRRFSLQAQDSLSRICVLIKLHLKGGTEVEFKASWSASKPDVSLHHFFLRLTPLSRSSWQGCI